MTAVANATFTAAQFNTHVRDNLNETAAAKATTAGRWFIATGANAIAERAIDAATIATAENSTATSYGDLATSGPSVTVTTGTRALVFMTAQIYNNTLGGVGYMSYAVSGASTVAAADAVARHSESSAAADSYRCTSLDYIGTLTPGSNTFTCKYRVTAGTGTWVDRELVVMAM